MGIYNGINDANLAQRDPLDLLGQIGSAISAVGSLESRADERRLRSKKTKRDEYYIDVKNEADRIRQQMFEAEKFEKSQDELGVEVPPRYPDEVKNVLVQDRINSLIAGDKRNLASISTSNKTLRDRGDEQAAIDIYNAGDPEAVKNLTPTQRDLYNSKALRSKQTSVDYMEAEAIYKAIKAFNSGDKEVIANLTPYEKSVWRSYRAKGIANEQMVQELVSKGRVLDAFNSSKDAAQLAEKRKGLTPQENAALDLKIYQAKNIPAATASLDEQQKLLDVINGKVDESSLDTSLKNKFLEYKNKYNIEQLRNEAYQNHMTPSEMLDSKQRATEMLQDLKIQSFEEGEATDKVGSIILETIKKKNGIVTQDDYTKYKEIFKIRDVVNRLSGQQLLSNLVKIDGEAKPLVELYKNAIGSFLVGTEDKDGKKTPAHGDIDKLMGDLDPISRAIKVYERNLGNQERKRVAEEKQEADINEMYDVEVPRSLQSSIKDADLSKRDRSLIIQQLKSNRGGISKLNPSQFPMFVEALKEGKKVAAGQGADRDFTNVLYGKSKNWIGYFFPDSEIVDYLEDEKNKEFREALKYALELDINIQGNAAEDSMKKTMTYLEKNKIAGHVSGASLGHINRIGYFHDLLRETGVSFKENPNYAKDVKNERPTLPMAVLPNGKKMFYKSYKNQETGNIGFDVMFQDGLDDNRNPNYVTMPIEEYAKNAGMLMGDFDVKRIPGSMFEDDYRGLHKDLYSKIGDFTQNFDDYPAGVASAVRIFQTLPDPEQSGLYSESGAVDDKNRFMINAKVSLIKHLLASSAMSNRGINLHSPKDSVPNLYFKKPEKIRTGASKSEQTANYNYNKALSNSLVPYVPYEDLKKIRMADYEYNINLYDHANKQEIEEQASKERSAVSQSELMKSVKTDLNNFMQIGG